MLFFSNALLHTYTAPQHVPLGTAQYNHSLLLLATEQLHWGSWGFGALLKGALLMVGGGGGIVLFMHFQIVPAGPRNEPASLTFRPPLPSFAGH